MDGSLQTCPRAEMIISKSTNVSGFASVEKSASESLQMVQRVKFTCLSCVWKAPGCVSGGSSLPPFFMFYFCVFSLFKKEEPTVGKSGLTESFPPPPLFQELYPNGTTGKCRVFGSSRGKDLMFKDNAFKLVRTPPLLDSQLYLGYDYWASVTNLRKGKQAGNQFHGGG